MAFRLQSSGNSIQQYSSKESLRRPINNFHLTQSSTSIFLCNFAQVLHFEVPILPNMISIQQTQISKITIMRAEKNIRNVALFTYSPRPSPNHFVRTMHHDLDAYERQVAGSIRRLQSAFNRNVNLVASQRCHPRWRRQEQSHNPIASRTRVSTQYIQRQSQSGRLYAGNKANAIVNEGTERAERRRIKQDNRCPSCSMKQVSHKRLEDKAKKKDEGKKQQERNPAQNSGNPLSKPCEKKKKIKAPKEHKKDESNELNPTTKKEQSLKNPNPATKQRELNEFDPAIRREQQKRESNQISQNYQQLSESNRAFVNREQAIQVLKTQNLSLKIKVQKLQKLRKQASSSPKRESQSQEQPTNRQLLYLILKKLTPLNYSTSQKKENNEQEAQIIHETFKGSSLQVEERRKKIAQSEQKKEKFIQKNRYRKEDDIQDSQSYNEDEQKIFEEVQIDYPSQKQGRDQFAEEEEYQRNIHEEKPKYMSIQSEQFPQYFYQSQKKENQPQKREQQLLSSYSSNRKSPGEDSHYDLLFRVAKDNQNKIRQYDRR